MKTLFIESKLKNIKESLSLPKSEIAKLPKELFLAYTIQFKEQAYNIAKQLQKEKIVVEKIQQVLGCSKINTKYSLLLIGQGRFHAKNLYLQAPKVFIFENNQINQIPESEIESRESHGHHIGKKQHSKNKYK